MRAAALTLALAACAAPAPRDPGFEPLALPADPGPPEPRPAAAPGARACARDADCGLDGDGRCAVGGRPPPPLVDQGPLCLCEGGACARLGTEPQPCEGDESCAIDPEPRPRPVARRRLGPGGASLPSRLPCVRGEALAVRCERTNLCTLRREPCRSE